MMLWVNDLTEPYFMFWQMEKLTLLFIYDYCCIVTDIIVTEPDVLRLIFFIYYYGL